MNTVKTFSTMLSEPLTESEMLDILGGFNGPVGENVGGLEGQNSDKCNKCDKCDKCTWFCG